MLAAIRPLLTSTLGPAEPGYRSRAWGAAALEQQSRKQLGFAGRGRSRRQLGPGR